MINQAYYNKNNQEIVPGEIKSSWKTRAEENLKSVGG